MREIINCSNGSLIKYIEGKKFILICIVETDFYQINSTVLDYAEDVFVLKIHDIEKNNNNGMIFNESNAISIIKFINKHEFLVSKILISCPTGISRSGAIAAALRKYFNPKLETFDHNLHNKLIYSICCKIFPQYSFETKIKRRLERMWDFLFPMILKILDAVKTKFFIIFKKIQKFPYNFTSFKGFFKHFFVF